MSSLPPISLPLLGSVLLVAGLATACTGDQSYTPIGEDQADEQCQDSTLRLSGTNEVALEIEAPGRASYSGLVEVTHSSRTEMHVDTDAILLSVPAGSIVAVSTAAGDWEDFSDMLFAVDLRRPGASDWQEVSVPSAEGQESSWFKDIDISALTREVGASTMDSCSPEPSYSSFDLDFDITEAYEMRVRPFPRKGLSDLVGPYDYTVEVEISE